MPYAEVFECPICGRRFETFMGLRSHIKVSRPFNSICPVCGKKCRNVPKHAWWHASYCVEHAKLYALTAKLFKAESEYTKVIIEKGIEALTVITYVIAY